MSNNNHTPPIAGEPFNQSRTCEIHKQLIDAALTIGGIAELAQWASMALAERIAAKHQTVSGMTVGDLIQLAGGAE